MGQQRFTTPSMFCSLDFCFFSKHSKITLRLMAQCHLPCCFRGNFNHVCRGYPDSQLPQCVDCSSVGSVHAQSNIRSAKWFNPALPKQLQPGLKIQYIHRRLIFSWYVCKIYKLCYKYTNGPGQENVPTPGLYKKPLRWSGVFVHWRIYKGLKKIQ